MKPDKLSVKWKSRTRHDLIIEVWEDLDCESVGARELEQIQEVLREKFGEGARDSPASIARKHGRPAERRHSLQIEINRRLYMDETTLAKTAGFAALQADLTRLIEALADYVRARS